MSQRILFSLHLIILFVVALVAPAFANEASQRLFDKGVVFFEEEDNEQAAFLFEQAVIADPAIAEIRFWLGRSYWEQDEKEKAQRAFDQAIAIDPAYESAYYRGGLADLELENREAAEKKYELLEKLCGDCEQALELRAALDKPEEEPFLDLFAQNDEDEEGDEDSEESSEETESESDNDDDDSSAQ